MLLVIKKNPQPTELFVSETESLIDYEKLFEGVVEVFIDYGKKFNGTGQILDLATKIWGVIGSDKIPLLIICRTDQEMEWALQWGLTPIKSD